MAGRQAAAQLLAELVGDGVPVAHFAEEGSRLEDAYLASTRRRSTATDRAGITACARCRRCRDDAESFRV